MWSRSKEFGVKEETWAQIIKIMDYFFLFFEMNGLVPRSVKLFDPEYHKERVCVFLFGHGAGVHDRPRGRGVSRAIRHPPDAQLREDGQAGDGCYTEQHPRRRRSARACRLVHGHVLRRQHFQDTACAPRRRLHQQPRLQAEICTETRS